MHQIGVSSQLAMQAGAAGVVIGAPAARSDEYLPIKIDLGRDDHVAPSHVLVPVGAIMQEQCAAPAVLRKFINSHLPFAAAAYLYSASRTGARC